MSVNRLVFTMKRIAIVFEIVLESKSRTRISRFFTEIILLYVIGSIITW